MNANLLSLAQQALGGEFSKLAGQFLGESPGATQQALTTLLPAVLGGIARKGATHDGAAALMSQLQGANLDVGMLGNIGSLFGGGGAGINSLLKVGTSELVPALFGDKSGALVSALADSSGLRSTSATNLVAMVVPLVLTFLKKFSGDNALSTGSLSTLLASQVPALQGVMDSRLSSALGFASPAAFLGGFGTQAADAARRAATGVASGAGAALATTAQVPGMKRWWPWIIGVAALLLLWVIFGNKWANKTMAPVATAPMGAPAAVALPAKIYFDVGSAQLGADSQKTLAAIADSVRKDASKISITGYTDKSGDATQNEQLAKSRALAVQDALKAAGVSADNIQMKPPLFVEVGAGGSDAEARRVEISRQ